MPTFQIDQSVVQIFVSLKFSKLRDEVALWVCLDDEDDDDVGGCGGCI